MRILASSALAAALGFLALAPQDAAAQGYGYDRPIFDRPAYDRRGYDHFGPPHHDRPWRRPRYIAGPGYGGPPERCIVRVERYFDGYNWVRERRRICR